jgi:hypothetical protein
MTTNKRTPQKHAEVIKAWADGAEIEFLSAGVWLSAMPSPAWAPSTSYRVKPTKRKVYCRMYRMDNIAVIAYTTDQEGYDNFTANWELTNRDWIGPWQVIEVEE